MVPPEAVQDYVLSGQGYGRFTDRPFTPEGNFAAAAGVQEMLLQSHRGLMRVFPAVPDTWRQVAFWHLRAEGALLVSTERHAGVTTRVEIDAEQLTAVCLVDRFAGAPFNAHVRPANGMHTTRVTHDGAMVWDVPAGVTLILRRVADVSAIGRTFNAMRYGRGCAAGLRCSGRGWPWTRSPKSSLSCTWDPAARRRRARSSLTCVSTSPRPACPSSLSR